MNGKTGITLNNKDSSIFGITITCLIVVGAIVVLIPISPTSAIYGCGTGTFYHQESNSCETYPELNKNQIKLSQSLVVLLEDTDSKMMGDNIEFDDRGYAKGKCTVMESANWKMNSKCIITLKNPMR